MPDLLWDDVKALFDPEVNGALPDVVVEGTALEDWQVLLDLVREQGWQYAYSVSGEPMEPPPAADITISPRPSRRQGALPTALRSPLPKILAIS
ncbi:hypothetical protein [Nonomuraea sp. NPDC048826]|uniref:hypothetical protein n=1 Tax=Nonomuraea sp. NPDC048826 TaxID=3364347 RepID=UPI003721A838